METLMSITCYKDKKKPGITLSEVMLFENLGMESDCHADGSERQITLLGKSAKEEQNNIDSGFCFTKMHENLLINGSIEAFHTGERFQIGEAVIEITLDKKRCFPELCNRKNKGADCLMAKELRFAKVIQSGKIHLTDAIIPLGKQHIIE